MPAINEISKVFLHGETLESSELNAIISQVNSAIRKINTVEANLDNHEYDVSIPITNIYCRTKRGISANGFFPEADAKRDELLELVSNCSITQGIKYNTTFSVVTLSANADAMNGVWTAYPQGVSESLPHEWEVSYKKLDDNTIIYMYGPVLRSNYGFSGSDGDSIQYIYKLFDHELTETERTNNTPIRPENPNSNGEFIPSGWFDDPQNTTSEYPFLYVSALKRINGTWGSFEKISLWSTYSEDGTNGDFLTRVFCRYTPTSLKSAPNTPIGGTYSNPLPGSNDNIQWSLTVPSGSEPLWASTRIFKGNDLVTTWSTPVIEVDTNEIDIEYSSSAERPANNTLRNVPGEPHPSTGIWHDPSENNLDLSTMIWRAERKIKNGQYNGEWVITKIVGLKGSFKSIVFRRFKPSVLQQTPATPTGGSYNNPIPDGNLWYDGIPAGDSKVEGPIWASTRTFYDDGTVTTWSEPKLQADSEDLDIEFSPNTTLPDNPTGEPFSNREASGWYDPSSNNFNSVGPMIWRAERKVNNGQYVGNWTVSRILGEKGADGYRGDFISRVFCRNSLNIGNDLNRPTGGSYESPVPTNVDGSGNRIWSDGIPTTGSGKIWSSYRRFYGDPEEETENGGTWSIPTLEADSESLDIEYSDNQTEPSAETLRSTPGGQHPSSNVNWYDPSNVPNNVTIIWRAERKISGTEYVGNWTISRILGERGEQGYRADYISRVFCRSLTLPETPTGGNYNSPRPTDLDLNDVLIWSDGIPSTGPGTIWTSYRKFYGDPSHAEDSWSTPVIEADSESLDIEYSISTTEPSIQSLRSTPSGTHPNSPNGQWYDPSNISNIPVDPSTNEKYPIIWRAERKISGTQYVGDWIITRILGEKGSDGKRGEFKSCIFKRSNSVLNNFTSTNDGATYDTPIPNGSGVFAGWSDGVPSGNGTLWMATSKFTGVGNTHSDWTVSLLADRYDLDIEFSPGNNDVNHTCPVMDLTSNNGNTAFTHPIDNYEADGTTPTTDRTTRNTAGWYNASALPSGQTIRWRAERKIHEGQYEGEWVITQIYGESGQNAVRLTLDNEHEDFLYSDLSVNPISPSDGATSTLHLYDGSSEKTNLVSFLVYDDNTQTWGTQTATGASASASISGNTLTINNIFTNSVKVKVRAQYPASNGLYYYGEFTANKVSLDKYSLILKPNAIAFNVNGTWEDKTITPSAKCINLQGTVTNGLTILTSESNGLRIYYNYLNADGSLLNSTLNLLNTATFTLTESPANTYSGIYFELRLYNGSNYRLCDYETVEIVKAANGVPALSVYPATAFKRSVTKPSATGGNYSTGKPSETGWEDSWPLGNDPIWMALRILTSDGLSPQQSTWTVSLVKDTEDLDIEFSPCSTKPANPNSTNCSLGNYNGSLNYNESSTYKWFDPVLDASTINWEKMIWMATRKRTINNNGEPTWSDWIIVKTKGESGGQTSSKESWFRAETTRLSTPTALDNTTTPTNYYLGLDTNWSNSKKYLYRADRYYLTDGTSFWDGPYFYSEWADQGPKGDDAVSITVSPSSLIINLDINSPSLTNLSRDFVVTVREGSATLTVDGISFTVQETSPNSGSYRAFFLNGMGLPSGNSSRSGNTITLKEIATYQVTENGETSNIYYDSLYVDITANYGSGKSISTRVYIYVNLLGTWKEKVLADTKREIALSTWFELDNNGNIVESDRLGTFERSSKLNLSNLYEQTYVTIKNDNLATFTIPESGTYKLVLDIKKKSGVTYNTDETTITLNTSPTTTWSNKKYYDRLEESLSLSSGLYTISLSNNFDIDNLAVYSSVTKYSQIDQKADSITSTVKTGTGNKNLFNFKTCTFRLATLDIGYPAILSYGMFLKFAVLSGDTGRLARVLIPGLKNGKSYTLSCQVKMTSSSNTVHIDVDLGDSHAYAGTIEANNAWKDVEIPLKLTTGYKWIDFGIRSTDYISGNYALLRNIKLEEGEIATTFCVGDDDANYITNVRPETNWLISESLVEDNTVTCPSGKKVYKTSVMPETPGSQEGETLKLINYISSNWLSTIEIGKIYTLSYWAKSSANETHLIQSYLYPNIFDQEQFFRENDGQEEAIKVDGSTYIRVTTEWKKHYIYFYVMSKQNSGLVQCIPFRLIRNYNGQWNNSGTVYISDVQFCEGYITENNTTINLSYSEIRQTADEITTELAGPGGSLSQVKQTLTNITSTVKGIQESGENLILNGAFLEGTGGTLNWNEWGTPTTREIVTVDGRKWMHIVSTTAQFQGYLQQHSSDFNVLVIPGEKYTLSFRAYSNSGTANVCMGFHWKVGATDSVIDSQNWYAFDISTTPAIYSLTITIPSGVYYFNVMVGDRTTTALDFYMTEIKFEKGEVATAWSPTRLDTYSEIKLTANSINLTVSSVQNVANSAQGTANSALNTADNINSNLVKTGINITGKRGIEMTADNFTLKDTNNNLVFGKDPNTNNMTFTGEVKASSFVAGDLNNLTIETSGNTIKFNDNGVTKAYFIAEGSGLLLYIKDNTGTWKKIDFTKWASGVAGDTTDTDIVFYTLRNGGNSNGAEINSSIEVPYNTSLNKYYEDRAGTTKKTLGNSTQYYKKLKISNVVIYENGSYYIYNGSTEDRSVYKYTPITITDGVLSESGTPYFVANGNYLTRESWITAATTNIFYKDSSVSIKDSGGNMNYTDSSFSLDKVSKTTTMTSISAYSTITSQSVGDNNAGFRYVVSTVPVSS